MSPSVENVICRKTPGRGLTRTFRKIWVNNQGRVWLWKKKGWFPLNPNKTACRGERGPDPPKTWRHSGCQRGGRISLSARPCLRASVTTTPQLGRESLYGNRNPRQVTLGLRQSENVTKQHDKADPFLLPSSVDPMFSKPIINPGEGIQEVFTPSPSFSTLSTEYQDYSNNAEHGDKWRNPARSLFDTETESEICSDVVSNCEEAHCDRDIFNNPELELALFQGFTDGLQEAKKAGCQWSDVKLKTNVIINMTLNKLPGREEIITKCINKAQFHVFPQNPTPKTPSPPTLNKQPTSP